LKRGLFLIITTTLILTACTVGVNSIITPIRITQVDGGEGILYVGDSIQLEVTPLGPSDIIEWSVRDDSHPNTPCAAVEQTGNVSGESECDAITVIAESSTGAVDTYPLIVKNPPDVTKKPIDKTR